MRSEHCHTHGHRFVRRTQERGPPSFVPIRQEAGCGARPDGGEGRPASRQAGDDSLKSAPIPDVLAHAIAGRAQATANTVRCL